jgi:hypothetical protein
MDEQWVEVRNCNWLHEAHFLKSVLEADGIEVLIPDEHLLGVQPLYANAVGGARVLVRSADLQRAARSLTPSRTYRPIRNLPPMMKASSVR